MKRIYFLLGILFAMQTYAQQSTFMYFEDKNKTESARLLDEAEKILAGTRYVAFIRKINALGYSAFDYNQNSTREKLDARLKEGK